MKEEVIKLDPWSLDSGLPDNIDAVITGAEFTTSPDYQDGQISLLKLVLEGADHDPLEVLFSLGKDWIIKDKGAQVEHAKGKQHFIATSIYGRFIHRVTEELKVQMPANSTPMQAEAWLGLAFHWEREELDFGKGIMQERGGKTSSFDADAVFAGLRFWHRRKDPGSPDSAGTGENPSGIRLDQPRLHDLLQTST